MLVSALIVSYQNPRGLRDCLRSIQKLDSRLCILKNNIVVGNDKRAVIKNNMVVGNDREDCEFEVIVVNNGGRGLDSRLRGNEQFKKIRLLNLNKNYGFAGGVNVGVKACAGEWVLVMNDDCEVREDFVEKFQKELDPGSILRSSTMLGASEWQAFISKNNLVVRDDREFQIYTVKILQRKDGQTPAFVKTTAGKQESVPTNNANFIYSCGDRIDEKGLAGNIGRGEADHGQYDWQKEVPLASFACVLVKRKLLERFPLDEEYFGYYEDVDFCLRVRAAGYHIGYLPNCVCYHVGEASFGKRDKLENEMQQFRNLSFTVFKHFSFTNIVRHYLKFNLSSLYYYLILKRKWSFLSIEMQILRKAGIIAITKILIKLA